MTGAVALAWPLRILKRSRLQRGRFAFALSEARTHTHLEKKSRTVMSRSCVISFPFDRRFRDSPSQGDNNIRVHATKRLWIATFKTRTGMLSNVAPISGPETAESSRRNGHKPEGNPRRKPPPCSAQGLSPQPGIQRRRYSSRRGRPLGC